MEQLKIVKTLSDLKELQDYLQDKDPVTFDTETTGVDKESEIIGFSICAEPELGYYVVLSYFDGKDSLIYLETKTKAKEIMEVLKTKQLVMHNAVFDCFMVKNNFSVDLIDSVHTDTMLLAHILNENRRCGLKELALGIFGEDSVKERDEMKESIIKNGGKCDKLNYELYKADVDLIAKYGAKDAILTMKIFLHMIPQLYEEGLDKFFYEDESMPLLRGPTYDMNTTGLKIDIEALKTLKSELEVSIAEAKAFITNELAALVKDKYPGDKKTNKFNMTSVKQMSWLLFDKLGQDFQTLTDEGKNLCKYLDLRLPYTYGARKLFIETVKQNKGQMWLPPVDKKTKKPKKAKKITDYWNYLAFTKDILTSFSGNYKWAKSLLQLKKDEKILQTYVEGIQDRMKYGVIRPSFLQHGTTSGRYSSKNPNLQNLPRKDKRVKNCLVARPGKVFVGADYSQLEPRVFASVSNDEKLINVFKSNEDFYSIIGMEVFNKTNCIPQKEGSPDAFGVKYPGLRDSAKVVALSSAYGTTAAKMAKELKSSIEDAQIVIDSYFMKFPGVKTMMESAHKSAVKLGKVFNIFGRPRRMPDAKNIPEIYGTSEHSDLPYEARNVLNLAVNHTIQSSGASIMNRAAIAMHSVAKALAQEDPRWTEVKIVLQVHDELILECPEDIAEDVKIILKDSMENTVILPNVALEANPVIAKNIAKLK